MNARELSKIDSLQRSMKTRFARVGEQGRLVRYLGKDFLVYKNVFWPFKDSLPLARNFTVRKGECVLDVGTGSGILAVLAAYKGAGRVVALDINTSAVKAAWENARRHGLSSIIEVRTSDMFDALKKEEKFDVILTNPPFRNKAARNVREAAQWDTGFSFHERFFSEIKKYLKPRSRIYMAQANYGDIAFMKRLARKAGFRTKRVGTHAMPKGDPRVFYAFELSLISR